MFVKKNFTLRDLLVFTRKPLLMLTLWAVFATCFTEFLHAIHFKGFSMPWLPVSIIGTAVAFYVGFKNNSAYDRLWEARKIWGGIVNSSRMWGSDITAYVSNHFAVEKRTDEELKEIQKTMIYRHMAWLYSLRSQLLIPTEWEHMEQKNVHIQRQTEIHRQIWGVGLFEDDITKIELQHYLKEDELNGLLQAQNTATQILQKQSKELQKLRERGLIEDFRHMELQKILHDFYTYQGQCERIKKFPLPRQYGSGSLIFVLIFLFLLPFAMVSTFHELSDWGAWLSIPFTILVGWVYVLMELIGDYSENPFEGLGNDIPMLALCRTIEIDLWEMLGETDIPPAIKPKDGVLM